MATIRLSPGVRNAIGTSKDDLIFGNELDNILIGNAGSDIIEGGAGADFIYGDAVGGANFEDTASYASSSAGVNVDLTRDVQYGGDAEGDVLFSIENLLGSAFDDRLWGDNGKNKLDGGAGNDWLSGGIDGLTDTLDGGLGQDTADYKNSGEGLTIQLDRTTTFTNQFGVQQVYSEGFAKTAAGVTEDILRSIENVVGTDFNDTITGNEKSNVLAGGFGADTINGLGGIDTVDYSGSVYSAMSSGLQRQVYDGQNGVDVDLSRTVQRGAGAEGDRLYSIENVIGSFGHDILNGNNAANVLEGGYGDDTIFGGGGNDKIFAGSGFDILDGGAGDDIFVYNSSDIRFSAPVSSGHYRRGAIGYDVIENFESGHDKIDLSALQVYGGAFVFTDAFTGEGMQLMYNGTSLLGDIDRDRIADFRIDVVGLQRSDVILG